GEADPSRPVDFELSVDGSPFILHRSSGAIVSSKLGSTAWMRAAWQVHTEQYLVREPTPRLQGGGSLAVAKEPHGLASSVTIRPLGWEPVLSLDGLSPHRLPTSSSITIEIEPEKKLWLHTASF
ncbi:MAG: hypothetical protein SGPRY_012160, partial [Prymnesium sp.]